MNPPLKGLLLPTLVGDVPGHVATILKRVEPAVTRSLQVKRQLIFAHHPHGATQNFHPFRLGNSLILLHSIIPKHFTRGTVVERRRSLSSIRLFLTCWRVVVADAESITAVSNISTPHTDAVLTVSRASISFEVNTYVPVQTIDSPTAISLAKNTICASLPASVVASEKGTLHVKSLASPLTRGRGTRWGKGRRIRF